jgi:hypothetical protein
MCAGMKLTAWAAVIEMGMGGDVRGVDTHCMGGGVAMGKGGVGVDTHCMGGT